MRAGSGLGPSFLGGDAEPVAPGEALLLLPMTPELHDEKWVRLIFFAGVCSCMLLYWGQFVLISAILLRSRSCLLWRSMLSAAAAGLRTEGRDKG